MSEVINLLPYLKRSGSVAANTAMTSVRRSVATDAAISSGVEVAWSPHERPTAENVLNASVLLRLDPDAELSKFLTRARETIDLIEASEERLNAKDNLGADDRLMASKRVLSELLMFREISDAIGLIVFKCFQAICAVKAVTDAPALPAALRQALEEIWAAPYLDFDHACEIVSKIETAAGLLAPHGYNELANELIGDATAYQAP
jgi:hypothetical protein